MSEIVLRCENLVITPASRPERQIVRGVSFALARGEVLGLIGESGAGKTTLGLAALGHLRAGLVHQSGAMSLCGQDLLSMPPEDLRKLRGHRISYVAQSAAASFNPALDLLDQITEPLRLMGLSRTQIDERLQPLLAALGLPEAAVLAKRYPHQMSGGQLQRAMIAMAMLPGPDVIVFDEPTTALDSETTEEVLEAIRKALSLGGAAALYISHDLELVCNLADRIMVLRDGAVIEEGDSATLRTGAQNSYTRALLSARHTPAAAPVSHANRVLEVEGLCLSYPGGPLLVDRLSFSVDEGETVALTGPSGSGKSSVMRAISGLAQPLQGQIRLCGHTLAAHFKDRSQADLAAIQIVHQLPDLALNPAQTVGLALARGVRISGRQADRALLEALMRDVELDVALLDRYPTALSGGQKQRVCIARALGAQPKLLICDEPTAALDPLVAKGVLETLARIQEERRTACLMITHDRDLVTHFCHHEVRI